jgi:hypothetical protein
MACGPGCGVWASQGLETAAGVAFLQAPERTCSCGGREGCCRVSVKLASEERPYLGLLAGRLGELVPFSLSQPANFRNCVLVDGASSNDIFGTLSVCKARATCR